MPRCPDLHHIVHPELSQLRAEKLSIQLCFNLLYAQTDTMVVLVCQMQTGTMVMPVL